VQTEVVFKLRCSKDGQTTDVDYPVEAFLKGVNDEVRAEVSHHFGVYIIKFHARAVGMYEMHVKVNNKWLYKDNDVVISIVENRAKKYVDLVFELDGPVLGGNLKTGNETHLIIYVKGPDGCLRDVDSSELEVRVGQSHTLQKLRTRRIGLGTFETDINVDLPGFYPIDVFFEERSVLKEPIRVQWISASDPKNTKACQIPTNMVTVGQQTSFYIQSRNKNDLNNTCGGDVFQVECNGPAELTDLVIRDTLNGKYVLTFSPLASGIYEFTITLNGVPIGNSPVKITAIRK